MHGADLTFFSFMRHRCWISAQIKTKYVSIWADRNINVRVDVCDQYERDLLPPPIALVAPSPSSAWPWTGIADSWQGTRVASAEKKDSSWALTNIQVGLSAGIFFFVESLCYINDWFCYDLKFT